MIILLLFINLFGIFSAAHGALAGGRPNAFSEGQNALAGVVNPANAVWIEDRLDLGAFWIHQQSSIDNRDDNPLFLPGKTDFNYKTKDLFTGDAAIHKQFKLCMCSKKLDSSVSFAYYTTPSFMKLHTKKALPFAGTTSLLIYNKVEVASAIFSFKVTPHHSLGMSIDFFHYNHERNGFQNSDNPLRSVSPGHVTNKGVDHSNGVGFTIGWRWRITKKLDFGAAWAKKTYCGRYKRYRGFEPFHAQNYNPQTLGGGFRYQFNSKLAGRIEMLWVNSGNLPSANNNLLPNGDLNLHKRGSAKSPGPGLQDATYINFGIGYQINSYLSAGMSYSHRFRLRRRKNILDHTYNLQTVFDILAVGANVNYHQHDLFFSFSYGFNNRVHGVMPEELGGGRIIGEKSTTLLSISWGYRY